MLLFVFTALSFGLTFAEETIQADGESVATMNETVTNETLGNDTLTNETLNNATLTNESLENTSLINESLKNATLTNETLNNLTLEKDETNPFGKVKGRQPSRR